MSTEKKKKLTKEEFIDKVSAMSETELQGVCGGKQDVLNELIAAIEKADDEKINAWKVKHPNWSSA